MIKGLPIESDGIKYCILAQKNKKLRSRNFGVSLELLARFELATRFPQNLRFCGILTTSHFNLPFGHGMRSPVNLRKNRKLRSRNFGVSLELLARFELATSSLPRSEGLRPSGGRSISLEYQGFSHFYRCSQISFRRC